MKTSSSKLPPLSPDPSSDPKSPAHKIPTRLAAPTRWIFTQIAILLTLFGQIPDGLAANSSGECNVTVNVTGGTLPAGWSYQLQYFDTDSNWYDGAAGTSTQTYYKQQGDWGSRSIQWRCQLKNNYTNYGTAQTNTCYSGSDSVSFSVSAPATASPPVITGQPSSQTIQLGASVTFSVAASGAAPLSYQWRKNGGDISTANAASYTISSVSAGDAGNYSCYVSNTAGNATSQAAVLTVSGGSTQIRFQIIQGSYTWSEAKANAVARGGRLAVLNTQSKIDAAKSFLKSLGTWPDLWMGLTDEQEEGVWRWINGDLITSNNWFQGEPNNSQGREDCAIIYRKLASIHENGEWNDVDNNNNFSYLLESSEYAVSLALPASSYGDIRGFGAYLPNTTATLTATANPGYVFTGWTGDAFGSTNPLVIVMDADKTIGATFSPDLTDNDSDGISAYDEVVMHGTDPALADTDGDGIADGTELGVGRYSVVSGSRTWAQARADAVSRGGMLATFATQGEWNRALAAIGADALLDIGGLWIGATDQAAEGTWAWISGESFTFASWASGQPDNLNDADFAAVAGDLGGESGKWYDYRATTSRDGYILESGYSTNPADADSDDDGLADGAELTAGSNPFLADTDRDGLTDSQEVNLTQTHPALADSDGDGLSDSADDQDGDELSNLAEITQHGTDPRKADSDDDGLTDGAELALTRKFFKGVIGNFTHPQAVADASARRGRLASFPDANAYSNAVSSARRSTQGFLWFGLSDAETEGTWKWLDGSISNDNRWLSGQPDGGTAENHAVVMENLTSWADAVPGFVAGGYLFERTGLDPLNPDTDGDGLSDGSETHTHGTDAFDDDSDNDQLSDGAEVNTHGSNPKSADTDGDGLNDHEEVVTRGTNPSARDTDGDGFDDLFEINTGFDPKLATSTPDALSSIRTAVEFRFNAANGVSYRIEDSTNLQDWNTVEATILGEGRVVTRFYSTENQPKRYFRVRRN